MRGAKIAVFLILGLILALSGPAAAENRAGAFNVTPFAGYYVFEGDQNLDNALTYGLGLGYNITENWGVELIYNRFDTDSSLGLGDADGNIFHLDGLYHFMPESNFVPYLGFGVGYSGVQYDWQDDDDDFNMNYGAGFKYYLTDMIALRLDARHLIQFGDPEHNFVAYGGLTFQFGGKGEEPPPPCPDSDNDGVCDDVDQCPNTPPSIVVDETGCGRVETEIRFEIKVEFDFNKATIRKGYHDVLREAAEFMKQYPNTEAVIEGHTDSKGSDKYNQKLSEQRARAVRDYLVKNFGLSSERLTAVGYGESRPVADNSTEEGRQRNRRVEAVLNAVKVDKK